MHTASQNFFRAHGLGNDYLVFLKETNGWPVHPMTVSSVCDRLHGVGSDGILLIDPTAKDPFEVIGYNPDGSEFERSGNGLRILGVFLRESGRVGAEPFSVRIGGDTVRIEVHSPPGKDIHDVSVGMGQARFGPTSVDLDAAVLNSGGRTLSLPENEVELEFVSVGNPHSVMFVDRLDEKGFRTLGPQIGLHPAYKNGTNVQMAEVVGEGRVQIRIWERGVGPTSASGTSSCAVAAAAVRRGLVSAGEVTLVMPGGELVVEVKPDFQLQLRGPVETVCLGTLTEGMLARLVAIEL